jgi:hypothetical protein
VTPEQDHFVFLTVDRKDPICFRETHEEAIFIIQIRKDGDMDHGLSSRSSKRS